MVKQEYSDIELKNAQKHIKKLKAWYWSLPMYMLGTAMMFILSYMMHVNNEPATIIWILISSTVAMWVIPLIQGLGFCVSQTSFVKAWEKRMISNLVKKEGGTD